MSEPIHTTAACGIAYASCYAIGADPSALILALIGSVGATMYVDEYHSLSRTYGAILLSTMLGGYGTPATLAIVNMWIKRNQWDIPLQTLEFPAPLVVGAAIVILLPYVVKLLPGLLGWLSSFGKRS